MTAPRPLDGITVVDFSRVLAGPFATQILAELGAEVIKIERPGGGDESRDFEPRLPKGESAYFFAFNRGKKSVTLDLKQPAGQRIAADLAGQADVVVENFLPGVMAGFGLGYPELSERNPGLVYISNTGFGQSGPEARRKGYDTIFQAESGLMSLTGYADSPPAKVGVPVSDLTSALWVTIAAVSALYGRTGTGRGAYVDLAMMDVQLSLLALAGARLFALDEDLQRQGTEHPGRVPSAAFECADKRWLHISASDQHWAPLCATLALDDLAADAALATNRGRLAAREHVMGRLREQIGKRQRDELVRALRAASVPVGAVNTPREALATPQATARGSVTSFTHPLEGTVRALRTPLRIDGHPLPAGVPPVLGADTAAVLTTRLGLAPDEIAALREDGVI